MHASNKTTRTKKWRLAALLSLCLAVSSVWVVTDSLFAPLTHNSETVEIPDFCGRLLDDVHFADWMEVETEYRYADEAAGTVLSQTPSGGSLRKLSPSRPSCTVSVVVSLGKERATVPSLVGTDVRQAELLLRRLGLTVRLLLVKSDTPEGRVLSVEPQAGTQLPLGETVTLTVSEGVPTATVRVPALYGYERSEALVALWTAQLAVGDVIEEMSDAPEGTVIRQSHQAGTLVTAGTKITLYVSRETEE